MFFSENLVPGEVLLREGKAVPNHLTPEGTFQCDHYFDAGNNTCCSKGFIFVTNCRIVYLTQEVCLSFIVVAVIFPFFVSNI